MVHSISFEIPDISIPYVGIMVAAQTDINERWLREAPRGIPDLYFLYPRIFYYEDPHHDWVCPVGSIPSDSTCSSERFSPIPAVYARRYGDCKDLASWRAAELRVKYGDARAAAIAIPATDPRYIHIVVQRGDGRREDPSKLLGMANYFAAKRAGNVAVYKARMLAL